jgi:glycosyltransferase involved in cell wall biosynthesis
MKRKTYQDVYLVSVIVITYNSEKYVLETLASIKAQTYSKIELIISDDNSTDSTIDICKKWIETNRDSFVNSQIVQTSKNTGISANCNRGVNASKGEWIKLIAGDDALLNDCIANNISFTMNESNILCVHSECELYMDNFTSTNYIGHSRNGDHPFNSKNISAAQQREMLLNRNNGISAPTLFVNKSALNAIDGFDESLRMLEDVPLWLNLTKAGFKLHFMDCVTVKYRLHSHSVQRKGKPNIDGLFARELILFNKKYINGNISKYKYLIRIFGLDIIIGLNKCGLNNNSQFSRNLFRVVNKFS